MDFSLFIKDFENRFQGISTERKETLHGIGKAIIKQHLLANEVSLNFVCTHNSRRSQAAQLLCNEISASLELPYLKAYSAGTEKTAFHSNMLEAFQSLGFVFRRAEQGWIFANGANPDLRYFSKTVQSPSLPDTFIAIMVCDDANENCPYIPNAIGRFGLPFTDPKFADFEADPSYAYVETIHTIGTEVSYLLNFVKQHK